MESGDPPSTTTISTIAVQAGKAKIVLAVLRSNEWIRVRIQQMEPDLMEVGATLEEAKALRREHDELLMKLNLKQKDVTELLAKADNLAAQNKPSQEVYAAMASSLSDAWKDLNTQLEYRKMLLDQSIAFHQSALQFSSKMEDAQMSFDHAGLAQDVEAARRLLQQHTDIKKSILESSMSTLAEGQSLLDRIREMGMRTDVQNRHATTAACYGIEHLLELLQDRRRRLDELWMQRRVQLEQALQMLLLDSEMKKVSDWFSTTGDAYLSKKELGDSPASAQALTTEHRAFESQAKEIHETVLRLVRTADQLVHAQNFNGDGIKQRLKSIDDKCENFMNKLDFRRKNIALANSFFSMAHNALIKLADMEVDLTRTDLPRNSAALAEKHAQYSTAAAEISAPALREGRILLERAGRTDSTSQGVVNREKDLQELCSRLEEMCKARYEAGEKSQAFNQFQEKYTTLSSWLVQIGQATLSAHNDLGTDVYTAKDFTELHEHLNKDLTSKLAEVKGLSEVAKSLASSGDADAEAAKERSVALLQQWDLVQTTASIRVRLATSYVHFHKKAQQLAIKMDAMEQYLKIEKLDATTITDTSIQHKEQKWNEVSSGYSEVETQGNDFIKRADEVKKDEELDTRRAVAVVQSVLQMFGERIITITDYYEHWKVHVSTGKEFKTQWAHFVVEARKTIDWVMKIEKDFFVPFIAGKLGKTPDDVKKAAEKMETFAPTVKKAQSDIEDHLKTAEMLSLKGDTHGQKDQIVNELLKVHTRFQARITEYQILLNMTAKFFTNLTQLDKLIEKTEKDFQNTQLPKEVDAAKTMLLEHVSNRDKMRELITFTSDEGEQIVVRVRQQDSEALAKEEVQKVLQMTEERRRMWEKQWEEHRNKLEQNLEVAQFYFDLKQIHQELDELNRQLDSRHGNYGSSLASVKMTSDAFMQFEASAKIIESRVTHFVTTAGRMIREQHYDSRRIRTEVDGVQKKWEEFVGRVTEYRGHLDESSKFFEYMELSEKFFHEGSQFLLTVGKNATSCKTSAESDDLIKQLDTWRTEAGGEQHERLGTMYKYIVSLYGQVQGPPKIQPVVEKTDELLNSFLKAMKELGVLRDNLAKKEQILAQMEADANAKAPKIPRFSQPLENAEIPEGQKFSYQCRLECDGEPKIEWFKNDMPLMSADYQTSLLNGTATLTIEETFSEDTATYRCRATTQYGTTETSAYLKVKETHQKILVPEFTKHMKSSEVPEGTQFMFECSVSGIPSPTISWFKEDQNIDNSPEYVITKINGTCCLKIRHTAKEHTARYTCKATNPGGEGTTTAKLTVLSVKKPHFHEPLKNVTVPEGKACRLECKFTGDPMPSIHWMRNDMAIMPSGVFKVIVEQNFTILEIAEVFPEDAGTYSVVARNLGGENRTSCVLAVEGIFSTAGEASGEPEPAAPRFVQHLISRDVCEGSRARLDCVITAHPEPEVIWFHNERPVKESRDFQLLFEGDRCSLIIREVYLEDSGDYKCIANNPYGSAESSCRLIVEPLSEMSDASATSAPNDVVPPKFTQLLKDLEAVEGRAVRFDCRVIGHPTPEVKWFREHTEIQSSPDFQISCHRELHSLSIPEVFKEDAGNFMCRAVNMAGEAKCYASLAVKPAVEAHVVKTRLVEEAHTIDKTPTALGITHQRPEFCNVFSDLRVAAGQPCRFEVKIIGNPRPRVRWLFNNEPIISPDYQISCFEDVYSLYIPEVFEEDAGRFSIIAENDSGKATCSALLEIVDASAAPPNVPTPPDGRERTPYRPIVKQEVAPVAVAPPVFAPPPPAPIMPVEVQVELPIGPRFIEELKNINVEEGARVVLQGLVEGRPEPSVAWFREGTEVTSSPDFQISYSAGRVTMTIPEVFPEDAGMFECLAHNEAGQVRSHAQLIVRASATVAPEFAERLITRAANEGESVRFTVRVTGKPAPEVTWYREGTQIISSPDFEIVTQGDQSSLFIPEVFYEDSGKFSVKIDNTAGTNTCTAELIVEAPSGVESSQASPSPPVSRSPSVGISQSPIREPLYQSPVETKPVQFSKPLQDLSIREGERVVIECIFPPYPEPQSVAWTRNDVLIQTSLDYQISYSHGIATLIISEVFAEDTGTISCIVTLNGVSSATFCQLTVTAAAPEQPLAAPKFFVDLVNQELRPNQTAYFECKVQGFPPPEILWTRRGHPLVDKERYNSSYDQYTGITTLTIHYLNEDDEGEYTCTAINSQGESTTQAMLLPPVQYAPPPPVLPPVVPQALQGLFSAAPQPVYQAAPPAPRYASVDRFTDSEMTDNEPDPSMAASPPIFEQKLMNFKLIEGSDATFVCKVDGNPKPKLQWFHNGRQLKPGNRYEMKYTREGYCSLKINTAFPEDTGAYSLQAMNIMGRDMCTADLYIEELSRIDDSSYVDPATLRRMMHQPKGPQDLGVGGVSEKYFKPVFRKVPADQEVNEGNMMRFDCVVSGRPPPEIFWYIEETEIHDSASHKVVINEEGISSLIIDSVAMSDSGQYTCVAANRGGEDRFTVRLNCLPRLEAQTPRFVERLGNVAVLEGQTLTLECTAIGQPLPMMSWTKDGKLLDKDPNYQIQSQGGFTQLTIFSARKEDNTWFQANAVNIAGTTANRTKVTVQLLPKQAAPDRKLVISKRGQAPKAPMRPVQPDKRGSALNIQLTPPVDVLPPGYLNGHGLDSGSTPSTADINLVQPDFMPSEPVHIVMAPPPAFAPPPPEDFYDALESLEPVYDPVLDGMAAPSHVYSLIPDTSLSPLMQYVQQDDNESPRPSTRELIDAGAYPAPDEGDMYNADNPRPPMFTSKPHSLPNVEERRPAHFECRLIPINDPSMKVQWFKDGKLVRTGHRFKPMYDFGFCILDMLDILPIDTGTYTCVARNIVGQDETSAELFCMGEASIIEETQLPPEMGSLRAIEQLENQTRRKPRRQVSTQPEPTPPVFDLMPEPYQCEEGDTAKFLLKISGFPRPRLIWWVNGAMIHHSARFKQAYDGMIHSMEVPKSREYDSGVIRCVAKNPLGEAECSTTLTVIAQDNWKDRLKKAPKSTVKLELEHLERRIPEYQGYELQQALKKPKTTVVQLREMERNAHERALTMRDQEMYAATHATLLKHSKMHHDTKARDGKPFDVIDNQIHIDRAKYMLNLLETEDRKADVPRIPRSKVERKDPPAFMVPLRPTTVPEGQGVKLEVTFNGFPTPTISWLREGIELQPCQDFQITTTAYKSFLWIQQVYPEDTGVYTVRSTNTYGVTECKAMITVQVGSGARQAETAPEFRVQMRDLEIRIGEPATFDVQVDGNPRPDAYWTKNGIRMSDSHRWKFIVEEDHFTLLVYEVTVADAGRYDCVVMNKFGKATCTANLLVDGVAGVETLDKAPPQFAQPLEGQQAMPGQEVILEVAVEGSSVSVTWFCEGRQVAPDINHQPMQQGSKYILLIKNCSARDSGLYTCRITNATGVAECSAPLLIQATTKTVPIPQSTQQQQFTVQSKKISTATTTILFPQPLPPQTTVNISSTARLECHIAALPPPRIEWLFNGRKITSNQKYTVNYENEMAVLLIRDITEADMGVYTCRAYSDLGEANTATTLFVIPAEKRLEEQQEAPRFINPLMSCEAYDGEEVILTCTVVGRPKPDVAWFHNGKNIDESEDFVLNYNRETGKCDCVIVECLPDDQGVFLCLGHNEAGQAKTEAQLTWKPAKRSRAPSEEVIKPAAVQVVQAAPEKETKIIKKQEFTVDGENRLDVDTTTTTEVKTIKKVVKKSSGEPPRFAQPIQPQVVMEGETVTFTAVTSGAPIPTITWLKDKVEMSQNERTQFIFEEATSTCKLIILGASEADVGIYSCRASNCAGRATCTANTVVVPPDAEVTVTEKTMSVKKEKVTIVGDEETRVTETSPQFIQPLFPAAQAAVGQNVTLECRLDGNPEPTLVWTHNGQLVQSSQRRDIRFVSGLVTLTVYGVAQADSGEYICRATNTLGETATKTNLSIGGK